MDSREVERLSKRTRELSKDRDELLRLEQGFSKVFLPDYLQCCLCKVCVCEGLILKPPTHESANGFLHLLLFLKPVVKTETIAQ